MADNEEIRRLAHEIKRANSPKAIEQARQAYISLFEEDEWRVTTRALADAIPILRTIGIAFPTECAVIAKILDLLTADHPIRAIGMGEPAGTHGIAHVMKGGILAGLYIKIKIENDIVHVLSFHQ